MSIDVVIPPKETQAVLIVMYALVTMLTLVYFTVTRGQDCLAIEFVKAIEGTSSSERSVSWWAIVALGEGRARNQ